MRWCYYSLDTYPLTRERVKAMTKSQVIETAIKAAKVQVKAYLKVNDLVAVKGALAIVKSLEEQKALLSDKVLMIAPSGEVIRLEVTPCYTRLTVEGSTGSACLADSLESLVKGYTEKGYKIKV